MLFTEPTLSATPTATLTVTATATIVSAAEANDLNQGLSLW